jgi:ubiquinone/menaquinone biosynthesis C-methylase UbiE
VSTRENSEWTGIRGKIGAWLLDNPLRKRREARFLDLVLESIRGNETVLDVGAGSGFFSIPVAQKLKTGSVVCLDLSPEMLARLQKKVERLGLTDRVRIAQSEASSSGLPGESVDVVISNAVLHELPNPKAVLKEIARVLKPGGSVMIKDFNKDSLQGKIVSLFHHKDEQGPFTPNELKNCLTEMGLRDIKTIPIKGSFIATARK